MLIFARCYISYESVMEKSPIFAILGRMKLGFLANVTNYYTRISQHNWMVIILRRFCKRAVDTVV